jgi:hypothetical protein
MIKFQLTFICILLLNFNFSAQSENFKLTEEKVKYQYDYDSTDTYDPKINIGEEMLIFFNCCFKDSVQVFINDNLIEKIYLYTNESTSYTGYSLKVKFEKNKETILKVVLPNKKVFCNITLDNKYKLLYLNRIIDRNENWWIIFRNFGVFNE